MWLLLGIFHGELNVGWHERIEKRSHAWTSAKPANDCTYVGDSYFILHQLLATIAFFIEKHMNTEVIQFKPLNISVIRDCMPRILNYKWKSKRWIRIK